MSPESGVRRCDVEARHYAGQTAQGEPISFDVTEAGTTVTNVLAKVKAAGPEPAPSTVIAISHAFPIDLRRGWGDRVLGRGIRATIEGSFGGDAEASGTLRVDFDAALPATPAGSTGTISWRARRVTQPP